MPLRISPVPTRSLTRELTVSLDWLDCAASNFGWHPSTSFLVPIRRLGMTLRAYFTLSAGPCMFIGCIGKTPGLLVPKWIGRRKVVLISGKTEAARAKMGCRPLQSTALTRNSSQLVTRMKRLPIIKPLLAYTHLLAQLPIAMDSKPS